MPSQTFDRFLKQLHAQGMEKADGFDASHFDGLSPDERPEAARLLREALLGGDYTAAEGLILLDPQAARPALEEALPKYSGGDLGRLNLVAELWKLTGEDRYQDMMIASLSHRDRTVRRRALVALEATPHHGRLMAALESVVLDDPDQITRSMAATHLLYGLGLIKNFRDLKHPYLRIENDLSNENRDVRQKALAEVKSQHPLPGNN